MNDPSSPTTLATASGNHRTYARYVAILDNPRPSGHVTELAAIAADLGLSAERIAADRELLARFHELDRIYGGRGVAQNEHRHRQHLLEEAKREYQNAVDEHSLAVERARKRCEECDTAAAELERLATSRPEVFAAGFPPRLVC